MKPLVFTGNARQLRVTTNYDLRANGIRFCQDFIQEYDDILYTDDDDGYDIPAWGYYGKGPKRTAMALIALSLAHKGIGPSSDNSVDWDDHPDGLEPAMEWVPISCAVERHYEAFTKRIIAKLPANWRMTSTYVKRWVKRQEKNEKQTTKPTKAKPKKRAKR